MLIEFSVRGGRFQPHLINNDVITLHQKKLTCQWKMSGRGDLTPLIPLSVYREGEGKGERDTGLCRYGMDGKKEKFFNVS
jgi:hypothetical protein